MSTFTISNIFLSLNVLTMEQTEFPFTYESSILFTTLLFKSFITSSLFILSYPKGTFPLNVYHVHNGIN